MDLQRTIESMPGSVKQALEEMDLMEDYQARPPYQQNDYLGWINRAKRQETKDKRLQQMLHELQKGGVYMNMDTSKSCSSINPMSSSK